MTKIIKRFFHSLNELQCTEHECVRVSFVEENKTRADDKWKSKARRVTASQEQHDAGEQPFGRFTEQAGVDLLLFADINCPMYGLEFIDNRLNWAADANKMAHDRMKRGVTNYNTIVTRTIIIMHFISIKILNFNLYNRLNIIVINSNYYY